MDVKKLVLARIACFFAIAQLCTASGLASAEVPCPPTITAINEQPVNSSPESGDCVRQTSLNLPRVSWWGGPSYYSQFPQAAASGWTDPAFFPISVFFGKPSHAPALKAAGINVYMGAEHDGSSMESITNTGMHVLAQDEWVGDPGVADNKRVVGWHVSDECEMGYSGCTPDWNNDNGEYGRLEEQKKKVAFFESQDDGRLLQANFGNGVLGTFWGPNTMDDHVALMDSVCVDKYAYTSPHVQWLFTQSSHWPSDKDPASASAYGWQQNRMETFMTPAASKPNWVFVETAKPFLTEDGADTIALEEIEGAVWNAIINGAAGIAYFQHNNNGACGTYSIIECEADRTAKVTSVNAQITRMAPVLNTQSYEWDFGPGLDTMLKAHNGDAYIFAMTDGGAGARTFALPEDVSGTVVEVVDEGRSLTVNNRAFSDTFSAEHTHHIYRISID